MSDPSNHIPRDGKPRTKKDMILLISEREPCSERRAGQIVADLIRSGAIIVAAGHASKPQDWVGTRKVFGCGAAPVMHRYVWDVPAAAVK